jgi:uncharacterized Zn finger protein
MKVNLLTDTEDRRRMLKLKIATNRMNYLIEAAQDHMEPVILERGWEYYHKGYVLSMDLTDGIHLQATVYGTKKYIVELNLENFSRSECTCPYNGYCKHMAAVFFNAYSAHGRPEMLLREMKSSLHASKKRSVRSSEGRAKKQVEQRSTPQANGTPKEWHKYFEQRFYGYSLNQQNSIDGFYTAAWMDLSEIASKWEASIRNLYLLHVLIFIMRKMDQFHQLNQASYLSYYHETSCRSVAKQCIEKLNEMLEAFQEARKPHKKVWEETISFIRETALTGKPGPVDWLTVYRLLWWTVFDRKTYAVAERQRLEQLLESTELQPRKKDALSIALAHFEIMEGQDDAAMQRLKMITNPQLSDFYMVLQGLVQREQWERLLLWLRWLLPTLPKARQDDFHAVCSYWLEAMKHQPTDEEWIHVMLSLLPRSYYYYTDYLMKTERFRQWVDLQLSHQISPSSLYTEHLKAVEKADPTLLLPLYHQAVEKAVAEKNRVSYKVAVRYLKRLFTIYKRLKQSERWEDYIYRLAKKYSRLRAFQEELQRGKWLL